MARLANFREVGNGTPLLSAPSEGKHHGCESARGRDWLAVAKYPLIAYRLLGGARPADPERVIPCLPCGHRGEITDIAATGLADDAPGGARSAGETIAAAERGEVALPDTALERVQVAAIALTLRGALPGVCHEKGSKHGEP